MKEFINVGLLGAGTVGGGVIHVLERNAADIEKKVGMPIRITKVFGREAASLAATYGDGYFYTANADDILEDPEIDIVVELLGREHPAKEFIAKAFENGKSVVTANKDVLAKYGAELFPLAEAAKRDFMRSHGKSKRLRQHFDAYHGQYGQRALRSYRIFRLCPYACIFHRRCNKRCNTFAILLIWAGYTISLICPID
ncbi:MAG: hypothetical protein IIU54_06200 [Phascolarctobacterium sp.]|nr:hypothetical protein [Phascolarctobacterium sp.]